MKSLLYIIITGKRKAGKDYVSNLLSSYLTSQGIINQSIHLSSNIKEEYAKKHNLDYESLLTSGDYKEKYRAEMVQWGEMQRDKDSGIFCRYAESKLFDNVDTEVVIVIAARRNTDIEYFINKYRRECIITVRLMASEAVRVERGWLYTVGIDDRQTETGLDGWHDWDLNLCNDGSSDVERVLNMLFECVKARFKLLSK